MKITATTIPAPFNKYYDIVTEQQLLNHYGITKDELFSAEQLDAYNAKHIAWAMAKPEYEEDLADGGIDLLELVEEGGETFLGYIQGQYTGDRLYSIEEDEILNCIRKTKNVTEAENSTSAMKKLQDAAKSVKCKLTPSFIQYATERPEDPGYLDDIIENELLFFGKLFCGFYTDMTSWEYGEDDEITEDYGSYFIVDTGTDKGRIIVQADGYGRIYEDELDFKGLKRAIKADILKGQFGYDDQFADYVNELYGEAIDEVANEVDDTIEVEPSVQAGRGGNFMRCEKAGTTDWDFEDECDILLQYATEASTEEEFKTKIKDFILSKYRQCTQED